MQKPNRTLLIKFTIIKDKRTQPMAYHEQEWYGSKSAV